MKEEALKIYNNYGYKNQLKKLSEEVYEFIEAVIEFENGKGSIEHVIEEMGDIETILYQFKEVNDIMAAEITDVVTFKLSRECRRIESTN